jgi:hypothetical protein
LPGVGQAINKTAMQSRSPSFQIHVQCIRYSCQDPGAVDREWTRPGGISNHQCGQSPGRIGAAPRDLILSPLLLLPSSPPPLSLPQSPTFKMLAARNFSAARQTLRFPRVAPSFVAPISQVPTPSTPSVANLQLTDLCCFD